MVINLYEEGDLSDHCPVLGSCAWGCRAMVELERALQENSICREAIFSGLHDAKEVFPCYLTHCMSSRGHTSSCAFTASLRMVHATSFMVFCLTSRTTLCRHPKP